jgi:ATP-dependent Clp protease protease subunit
LDEKTRNAYLSQGIVLLGGVIGKTEAIEVLSRIEYLRRHRPGREIKMLINSPGGMVKYSLAIYDEMKKLEVPIATGCAGMADGSASMLLAAGTRGRRSSLSHAVVHVTDIWSAKDGIPAPEQLEKVEYFRKKFIDIWAGCSGQTEDVVRGWMNSQKRFTAEEALHAGIIDFVVPTDEEPGGENGNIPGLFRTDPN